VNFWFRYHIVNQKRKEQPPAHERLQCAAFYVKNICKVEESDIGVKA
jgi:hypothetical protein